MTKPIVRIGGASGAWGDSPQAIGQLLRTDVDYLMMDYLAEVTMSLLARARLKDPTAGYPEDFVTYVRPHLSELARRGVKLVTNAGGVNPAACKAAIETICKDENINLRVAVVLGDDLMPIVSELSREGVLEAGTGKPIPERLLTANAYLGAIPIAQALRDGADIVITGRCVDSALALGILMKEFDWAIDDYDRLAAGSLVGHLLECGPQSTGGLFTDWESVPDWYNIGYPIAECNDDGSFILTKPLDTGGLVTPQTAAEQVLYEIGDPGAYLLPDVIADFTEVTIAQAGVDRVRIEGARGRAPGTQYKVSATFQDGFRAVGLVSIVGIDAYRKAQRTADQLLRRAYASFERSGIAPFTGEHVEIIGGHPDSIPDAISPHCEGVLLRLVVDHTDAKALATFAREFGSVGLSFAPGTTGLIGGRPKIIPIVKLCTFYVQKSRIGAVTILLGADREVDIVIPAGTAPEIEEEVLELPDSLPDESTSLVTVPLLAVAHARSGDKGDSSNVAVFCRNPAYRTHLRKVLTAERIALHFADIAKGPVVRYEAPGIHAFNFVIENALGGGGMASPRLDSQGKAYGQRALELKVEVPASWDIEQVYKQNRRQNMQSPLKYFASRGFALMLVIFLSMLTFSGSGLAQGSYPDRPITIIVPFSAGSGTDVVARALTVSLGQQMKGASFIVDNRPGANGIIAAGAAAKSAPDGYTLLLTTNTTHSVNPFIYKSLPYDPNTDFVGIGLLGETAPALLTATTNPANTIKDIVAAAKASKDGLNFATTNTSSLAATQLFERQDGVKLTIIKYKSAPQALTDLTGGTIDFFFGDLASGGSLVRGGKLKALAVLSDKRLPGFPNVPTVGEAGSPHLEIAIWIGLFAPKGTPAAVVQKLNAALVAAQKQPELIKALGDAAVNVKATTTDEFAAYVASQYSRWGKLSKELDLQVE